VAIDFVGVDDFKDAVMLRCGVKSGRSVNGMLANLVEVAVRISGFIPRCRMRFFIENCIFMAIYRRVDAYER